MGTTRKPKAKNGEGSAYYNGKTGKFEHYLTSKYINPKTLKPKRVKGIGDTADKAEKDARLKLKKWEYAYENDKDIKPDKTKTFGAYMKDYMTEIKSKEVAGSTYKSYCDTLNYTFYKMRISKYQLHMLNKTAFQTFYNTVQKRYAKSTQITLRSLTRNCMDWLQERGLVAENYARIAKPDKEVRDEYIREQVVANSEEIQKKEVLTDEDILTLYNAMKKMGLKHKYLACYVLQIETFIRAEELRAIRLDDIDYENKILTIRSAIAQRYKDNQNPEEGTEKYEKVTKGGDERIVGLSPWAMEAIEQLKLQLEVHCRTNPNNLLVCNYNTGDFISASTYRHMFHEDCDRLGIVRPDRFGPHKAFRHTGVTMSATRDEDANLKNIALAAGHKDYKTQAGYIHATEEAIEMVESPLSIINKKDRGEEVSNLEMTEEMERLLLKKLLAKYGDSI